MVRTSSFAVTASVCALLVGPACATGSSHPSPAEPSAKTRAAPSPGSGDTIASAQTDAFSWQGRLSPSARLDVRLVSGNIRLSSTTGDEVKIRAKRSGDLRAEPWLRVERQGDNVRICSLHNGATECDARAEPTRSDVGESLEVVVEIPRGRGVGVNVVSGSVFATSLTGAVRLSTVSGDVTAQGVAPIDVSTVHGDVRVSLPARATGAVTLTTVSGGVTLSMPRSTSASVEASTLSGTIESAFDEITPVQRIPGQQARGKLGSGDGTIRLQSVQGTIRISEAGDQPHRPAVFVR